MQSVLYFGLVYVECRKANKLDNGYVLAGLFTFSELIFLLLNVIFYRVCTSYFNFIFGLMVMVLYWCLLKVYDLLIYYSRPKLLSLQSLLHRLGTDKMF